MLHANWALNSSTPELPFYMLAPLIYSLIILMLLSYSKLGSPTIVRLLDGAT
jgi:hypothetical protein